jgi:3-oxoacyl-[acyl-carrier protein] reductase
VREDAEARGEGRVDLGIEGKVALVLGASRGIGRGIATVLAREGVRVAIASRSSAELEKVATEIEGEVTTFEADTGDLERMRELTGTVIKELGPVEILVLNTGGPRPGTALDNSLEDWENAFRSLVLAPAVLVEAAIPEMRKAGWGRIVNVASSSVREPIPGLVLSNANRMAAVGFLKTLATEVAADGITVNTVATGRFATDRLADPSGSLEPARAAAREQVPAARLGTPEEYGDLVAFLCSERAAYLTGAVIPLDGGMLRSA